MIATNSNHAHAPDAQYPPRESSFDVLRGILVLLTTFAFFGIAALREWPGIHLIAQFEPSVWQGVRFMDLIEPGFLFVLGLSAASSADWRKKRGESRFQILIHLGKRCIGLFVLGFLLENWLPTYWPEIHWLGVYQRLAICNLGVGIFCVFTDWPVRLGIASLLLVNYGFAFESFSVPPPPPVVGSRTQITEVDPYSMEYNLAAYVDQTLLPGRKYYGTWDRYGLLTTIPAFVIALLGSISGIIFLASRQKSSVPYGHFVLIAACAIIAFLLNWVQPINPILQTPAFVLLVFSVYGAGLVLISRLVPSLGFGGISRFLQNVGYQSLPLMFILHVAVSVSVAVNAQTSHSLRPIIPYPQTITAIWFYMAFFVLSRWMSLAKIHIRL